VKLLKITTFFALAAAALTVPAGAIVQAPAALTPAECQTAATYSTSRPSGCAKGDRVCASILIPIQRCAGRVYGTLPTGVWPAYLADPPPPQRRLDDLGLLNGVTQNSLGSHSEPNVVTPAGPSSLARHGELPRSESPHNATDPNG
jgi:hypothetical protein